VTLTVPVKPAIGPAETYVFSDWPGEAIMMLAGFAAKLKSGAPVEMLTATGAETALCE
jgi:hypothetical protein